MEQQKEKLPPPKRKEKNNRKSSNFYSKKKNFDFLTIGIRRKKINRKKFHPRKDIEQRNIFRGFRPKKKEKKIEKSINY